VVMAYLKVLPYHFPYLSQVSWYNDQQSNWVPSKYMSRVFTAEK
jgi:hypothetical protein